MKKVMRFSWAGAILLGAGLCGAWAHEGHEDFAPKQEQLGEVRFPVSCNAAAQSEFNHAMAMVHSFWFNPAIASFKKVRELDAECGMADWGIALMSMGNPFAWPANPKAMGASVAAIADAERVGAKTERERDYISALAFGLKRLGNSRLQRACGRVPEGHGGACGALLSR